MKNQTKISYAEKAFFFLRGGFFILFGFGTSFLIFKGCKMTCERSSWLLPERFRFWLVSSSPSASASCSGSWFSEESVCAEAMDSSVLYWNHGTSKAGIFGIIAAIASVNLSDCFLKPSAKMDVKPRSGATVSLRRGTWPAGVARLALSWIRCDVIRAGFADLHTSKRRSSFFSSAFVTSLTPIASCLLILMSVHPGFCCWPSVSSSLGSSLVLASHFPSICFFVRECFFFLGVSIFLSPTCLILSSKVCSIKCISSPSMVFHWKTKGLSRHVFTVIFFALRSVAVPCGITDILRFFCVLPP